MKNKQIIAGIGLLTIIAVGFVLAKTVSLHSQSLLTQNSSTVKVVAAENFYGNVVQQIGGTHVTVTSILSDPNTDPHEYESNVQDGIAVNNAAIVIENGQGYDTWMDKLLSAAKNPNRVVLVGTTIAGYKLEDNPHVWYGIANMQDIAIKIADALKKADPKDAGEFNHNLTTFTHSLESLQQKIADIKATYANTPVGLTETIYLYQSSPEGLRVLTPLAFEKAIAEGNEPSADDVATTNDQIVKKQVKVLIYNVQTITPITTNLENEAKKQHIPVVPVSETLPKGKQYQTWMMDQLTNLENALQSSK